MPRGCRNKWKAVSSFVNETRVLNDKLSLGAVLSIASKAESYGTPEEPFDSALYYGQNYTNLAKYVDLFRLMTYFLDYNVLPEDVGQAARWVKELTGETVFADVQTHRSKHPYTRGKYPTPDELKGVLKSCKENNIGGVAFFALYAIIEKYSDYASIIKSFRIDKP